MVRAKFKCTEKKIKEVGEEVVLQPVTSGSNENESFYKHTPYGAIALGILNADASKEFEVGKEYYVDFTKVE